MKQVVYFAIAINVHHLTAHKASLIDWFALEAEYTKGFLVFRFDLF